MSHEVKYTKALMPELHLIREAAPRVGCEVLAGQKTRKTYGNRQVKCDHAIRVTGDERAYEAGLLGTPAGYIPEFDTYGDGGSRLEAKLGIGASRLVDEYAKVGVEQFARVNGYTVESCRPTLIDNQEATVYEILCA